jgi:hypothetical protein
MMQITSTSTLDSSFGCITKHHGQSVKILVVVLKVQGFGQKNFGIVQTLQWLLKAKTLK